MPTSGKYLSADTRRALTVQTVLALAASGNPSEITTAAIAADMSVTQGSLFRHFENKAAIWQSVMEWVTTELMPRIEQAIDQNPTPLTALRAIFSSHLEFVEQWPGVPRILFGELQRTESTPAKSAVQMLLKQYAERVQGLLKKGVACGDLHSSTDTKAASVLFVGTIQGLVMQSMLAGDINQLRRKGQPVFDIYQRGIEAHT